MTSNLATVITCFTGSFIFTITGLYFHIADKDDYSLSPVSHPKWYFYVISVITFLIGVYHLCFLF